MKKVAVIGTGRLGSAIARGLKRAGFRIAYLASEPLETARELAEALGGWIMEVPYKEISEVDIVFLTVPDDEIESISKTLAEQTAIDWRGKLVVHCSGALTSGALDDLRRKGAAALSLHPLQTFPPGSSADRFRGVYFAIEGDDKAQGEAIARSLKGLPLFIEAGEKAGYHAAAALASNCLLALADAAGELLERAGVEPGKTAAVLTPLMQGAVDSIRERGIQGGITGPISRGDVLTVKRHLQYLKNHPEILTLYKILGLRLLKIADLPEEKKGELSEILGG